MELIKVLRLRPSITTIEERLSYTVVQQTGYKGAISDVRLEVYVENITSQDATNSTSYDEFELKFIEIAKVSVAGQAPTAEPVKRYSNINNQFGDTRNNAMQYVIGDFITTNAYTILMSRKSYSYTDAEKQAPTYYKIVQDPWVDEPPLIRSYGNDPYFLNNGIELTVFWTDPNTSEAGGVVYSNDDGSESYNKSLIYPGKTPSVPFGQDVQDIEYAKSEKKKISKNILGVDNSTEVRRFYTISSNDIKITGTGSIDTSVIRDNFPGDNLDIDIINKFIDIWKKKVPNYDLKICQPSYYPSLIDLEFKSPLENVTGLTSSNDNQPAQSSDPNEVKFKLSIVYDKNKPIKADADAPDINIYVGEPPKEGEFLFDEDEFDDLALLDEEYREDDFKGEEELAYALNNTGMEGVDGELSIDEKKESALRTEELSFEGLTELRRLPKKGVGKTETERANNLYAEPYGLTVKTVEQAKSESYKKLLEKTNFGTEMYFSGVIMGNKQKLINSSTGSLESVFMSELKYNGELTWKNDAGAIFKTGKGATFKPNWPKLNLLVHKAARAGLESAYAQIQKEYGLDKMWDLGLNTSSGTYFPRAKRNGANPSIHSWGVAIDICAGLNGLTTKCPSALFCKQEYKRFIDIMEAYGWYSLGRSWGQDYMHFQAV